MFIEDTDREVAGSELNVKLVVDIGNVGLTTEEKLSLLLLLLLLLLLTLLWPLLLLLLFKYCARIGVKRLASGFGATE